MRTQAVHVASPESESPARPVLAECPQLEALTVESLIVPVLQAQLEAIWPQEVDLLRRYALPAAPALLDVGCGTGEFVARLAALWPEARITGLDLAPTLLDIARRRTASSERITYLEGNGAHLPFEDGSLDGVFCRHVLHAVNRPELILDEMIRVLKPGGVLHLLAEDYGMIYSSRGDPDLDRLWREGWIAAGENSGIDLRIGRKVPAMLLHRRMREVRMSFAQVDSLRVSRGTLSGIFQHWKAFANDWVAKNASLPARELNTLHEDLLATLDDPNEHVLWMVPLISAVKPV
ncbi:class I SAM-dependent methyltransferase [Archangium sp.]|uniref:class I SAM-dependent methyltransferase n=1 Tax=Archangium sp. TaxID=1872627 RepID=UPI002ED97F5E